MAIETVRLRTRYLQQVQGDQTHSVCHTIECCHGTSHRWNFVALWISVENKFIWMVKIMWNIIRVTCDPLVRSHSLPNRALGISLIVPITVKLSIINCESNVMGPVSINSEFKSYSSFSMSAVDWLVFQKSQPSSITSRSMVIFSNCLDVVIVMLWLGEQIYESSIKAGTSTPKIRPFMVKWLISTSALFSITTFPWIVTLALIIWSVSVVSRRSIRVFPMKSWSACILDDEKMINFMKNRLSSMHFPWVHTCLPWFS